MLEIQKFPNYLVFIPAKNLERADFKMDDSLVCYQKLLLEYLFIY